MEKKTLKTKKVSSKKIKYFEVSGDILVPDVKPDIISVISVNTLSYIYKEDIQKDKVRLDGMVDSYISYISDSGELRSIKSSHALVEQIEDDDIDENSKLEYTLEENMVEAKVLNERKVSLKIKLKLEYNVYNEQDIELPDFSTNSLENVEKLEENITVKKIIGFGKGKSSVKEKLKLGDNLELAEILKVNVDTKSEECKMTFNKGLAKADIIMKVMFLTENGTVEIKEEKYNAMCFVDIDGVTDKDLAKCLYKLKNVQIIPNDALRNELEINLEFDVEVECYAFETINVIEDMYMIDKDVKVSKEEKYIYEAHDIKKDLIEVSERIRLDSVSKVHDMDLRIIFDEKKDANLEVKLYVSQDSNTLSLKILRVPFIVNGDFNSFKFNILEKRFSLNGEFLELDVKIEKEECYDKPRKISILDNIEIENKENDDCTMCMYFVKKGDTIFNIAKEFNMKKEQLLKINGLESEEISSGDRLFIVR